MQMLSVPQLANIIRSYPPLPERFLLDRCEKWVPNLNAAMCEFEINNVPRVAHFIAQTAHESGRFFYTRELWGPTRAQRGYEGRKDLGNTQPGDGFRFRGRGPIQITGRSNYRMTGAALGIDLLAQPDLLAQIDVGCRAAAYWWRTAGLNELADRGNIDHVSDRINRGRITAPVGDSNGFAERKLLTERALKELGGGRG